MKKKNTDGLQQELMDSPDLTQFLSQNQEQFVNKNVAELLNHLFEKKNISKAALAKQSGMSEIYLHQIFAGRPKSFPKPSAVSVLRSGCKRRRNPGIIETLWKSPIISQAET